LTLERKRNDEGLSMTEDDRSPPPADEPAAAGFDFERAMARFGGDRSLFDEMVEVFFNEVQQTMEDLRRAAAAEDLATAERAAHSLKGSIAYFGAEPVVDAARRVEQAARARDAQQVTADSQQLDRRMAALAQVLTPLRRKPA
jgi:two-component system, sensor histidine kinase and response regulator